MFISCNKIENKSQYLLGSSEQKGKKIFERMACNACHSIDGKLKLAPSIKNQYGKELLHTDGSLIIVDDKYIKESIVDPLKYLVEGYTPIMPSYRQILTDEDIENIISYIKALK